MGHGGIVISHPCSKNENAARKGHRRKVQVLRLPIARLRVAQDDNKRGELGVTDHVDRGACVALIKLKEPMLKKKYAEWMYEWETRLTTRDENRVVRPLEWGFEWIEPFLREHGLEEVLPSAEIASDPARAEAAMVQRESSSYSAQRRILQLQTAQPTSGWKSGIRSCFRPTCGRRRWRKTRPSNNWRPRARFRRRSFCGSLRRSELRFLRTIW